MTFFRQTRFRPSSPVGNLPLSLWRSSPGEFKAAKGWWGGCWSHYHTSSSLVNPEEMWCCASRKSQISELNFSLVSPGSHARRTAGPLGSCWAAHVVNAKDEDKYGGHLNNSAFFGGGDIYAGNTGFRRRSYHRRCCASVILIGSMRWDGAGSKRIWSTAGRHIRSGGKAVWGGLSPPHQAC